MSIHAADTRALHGASASGARLAERADPRLAPGALLRACGLPFERVMSLLFSSTTPDGAIDRALGEGLVPEQTMLRVLASRIGGIVLEHAPPPAELKTGSASLMRRHYAACLPDGRRTLVIAPDGAMAARLFALGAPTTGTPMILVTRQALLDALTTASARAIAHHASEALASHLCARSDLATPQSSGIRFNILAFASLLIVAMTAGLLIHPLATLVLPPLLLVPIFTIGALTICACLIKALPMAPVIPALRDTGLPRYSVLVPLFREANILPSLIQRLGALDYPREKLEIILLIEADDDATRAALAATSLPPFMVALTVPQGAPRTKPRALNAGLLAATGDLIVVFDAEDAPEPDQLRRAAAIFAREPRHVACVQARLAISNVRDNWLTRRFAIDYAALFDCGKSGMARLGWPVPLGGSSNHFRAEALRAAGGWDAWNVTEDADLGIRLARRGALVRDLPSTTWEEAPNRLSSWMNQRTRWMKGWMQTLIVHGRNPRDLIADLGVLRATIIGCFGLAVVLGALLFPLFIAGLCWRLMSSVPFGQGPTLLVIADVFILESLVLAVVTEVAPALVALRRRGALRFSPWILLAPITHVLTSIAAWRGLFDLIRRPHHWHKTTHGEARVTGGLGGLSP